MEEQQDDPRGFVLSHESAGALDGPGLRHVIFLSGCQMRCHYCHNPESWRAGHGAWVKASEALSKVAGLASFYRNGGGLTLSGGEPLLQAEFCHALARGAKAMGLHVALDTNGELHENLPDSFFDPIDMLLLDIKHSDPAAHKELTGRDLAPVLDCARRLSALGKEIWVRHVVVPGKTDSRNTSSAWRASSRRSRRSRAWTSCRSMRWAPSNGHPWAWRIPWRESRPPATRSWRQVALSCVKRFLWRSSCERSILDEEM